MIISNMLFSCFRGSPLILANAVPNKPHHARCAGFCSVHYKIRMQKNENFIKKMKTFKITFKMMLSSSQLQQTTSVPVPQSSDQIPSSSVAASATLTTTSPCVRQTQACLFTVNGAGSLPALISQLILFGDSNHPGLLMLRVYGDSNVLMPMLRVEGDLVNMPIVPFLPHPVDLSRHCVIDARMQIDADLNVTFLPRPMARSRLHAGRAGRLLYTRCARLRHDSQPAPPGIANTNLSDGCFSHCSLTYCNLTLSKCECNDDCSLTDNYINTYYVLYIIQSLFLETGKIMQVSLTPA